MFVACCLQINIKFYQKCKHKTFVMHFFLVLVGFFWFFFGAYVNSTCHHFVIATQNPAGVHISMRKTATTSLAFLLAFALLPENFSSSLPTLHESCFVSPFQSIFCSFIWYPFYTFIMES